MKTIFYMLMVLAGTVFFSCDDGFNTAEPPRRGSQQQPAATGSSDPLLIEIRDMEARAKTDSVIDRAVGLRLLKAYQDYYNKHSKDSLGLAYLFEAGRVADAMGKYEKAVDLLINYHDAVANIDKRAEAAYLVAFIYDAHLHDTNKAIQYYNKVIDLYPNSTWAEQAKAALHLVGKSDEELLKFLQEKNKQPA